MCGRYATGETTWEQYRAWLNLTGDQPPQNVEPRWNIAPTVDAPIAVEAEAGRHLMMARWGIWQPWMKDKRLSTFNARSETLGQSRLFAPLLDTGRCLVPAMGFYEWTGPKSHRQPFFIRHRDEPLLVFAGLWTRSQKDGEQIASFTILTTAANEQMRPLHDRMPVILDADEREAWIAGEASENITRPWTGQLDIYPVAPLKREDGPWQIERTG